MRTRGAARGGAGEVTGDAQSRTVPMFEQPAAPKPTGMKFYKCACGLVQVWGSGACIDASCKKSLLGRPQVPERDVPQSQDVRLVPADNAAPPPETPEQREARVQALIDKGVTLAGDDARLAHEMIQRAAAQAKAPSARDKIAAVFGSTAPRAAPDPFSKPAEVPGELFSKQLEKKVEARRELRALEQDFGALCNALAHLGVVQLKNADPLTLSMIAKWTPEMRALAAAWCEGAGPRPEFLANGVEPPGVRDPHDDEVVVDEEGDARTRAEMREKHKLVDVLDPSTGLFVAKEATSIDAQAPEMRAALGLDKEPKGRGRRIVHGAAASQITSASSAERAADAVAETITVTWGQELYSPVQYNTCSIGPYSMTVVVRPGQSRDDAFREASAFLARLAQEERDKKIPEFVAKVREVQAAVRR